MVVSKLCQMSKSSYYILLCICLSVLTHLGFLGHIWRAGEGFPCSGPAFGECLSKYYQRISRNGQKCPDIKETRIKTLKNLKELNTVINVHFLWNLAFLEQCFSSYVNLLFSELHFQSIPNRIGYGKIWVHFFCCLLEIWPSNLIFVFFLLKEKYFVL